MPSILISVIILVSGKRIFFHILKRPRALSFLQILDLLFQILFLPWRQVSLTAKTSALYSSKKSINSIILFWVLYAFHVSNFKLLLNIYIKTRRFSLLISFSLDLGQFLR